MYFTSVNFGFLVCLLLALEQFGGVQSSLLSRVRTSLHNVVDHSVQNLCYMKSDELMRKNGYLVEEHTVTTDDGYILTVYRCNSKKPFSGKKKPLIMQHGIMSSSDDFCINIPEQAPAYVFADAGYDVWLPNSRGNTYSRNHTHLSTSNKKFWDFSWTELALHDYPATIDYVLQQTGNSQVYYLAHSQGTTSLFVLLSELPEYNQKIAAASLLAPVSYLGNSGPMLQFLGKISPVLNIMKGRDFGRRTAMSDISGAYCSMDVTNTCNLLVDLLFGWSSRQRNETMTPAFVCHNPSGASVKQIMHFGQEIKYGFFGNFKEGRQIPRNFDLSRITTPLTLHYSPGDTFTNPKDVHRLISELKSVVYVQEVTGDNFNHMDFLWGIKPCQTIYPKIMAFYDMF